MRYADLCLNLNCNLTCAHCFATNFEIPQGQGVPLSTREWSGAVDQLMDLGGFALGITGGEPLLNPRLEELMAASHPREMLIIMASNGWFLTRERAKRLHKLGLDVVQISVDSADEEEHDRFRGKAGSWRRALEAVDNALAAGIRPTMAPTVSHMNIRSAGFLDLVEISRKKGVLLNLSLAAPSGNWNGNTGLLLTEEDSEFLNQLIAGEPHVRRDFETNYWKQGCGAGKEKLYITTYGDVIPCPYMHISFGNIRDLPLAQIRQRMLSLPVFKEYHPRCLVAEDSAFIQGPLSKTWNTGGGPADWKSSFPSPS
jgi:MoaA/NifB/PqqE/SkfB family radical SAM enzyme